MRSAIYEGEVVHRRRAPSHRFTMRVAMPLLDLSEIDEVVRTHPLWSREGASAVSFRRSDHLGDPARPLDECVRDLVHDQMGARPRGPISLLAHLRTWGWLFNPIALYYCYDTTGTKVEHVVAHVTNTPWKERHAYVLGAAGTHVVDKAMHVSPFFGMDHTYRITYTDPAHELRFAVSLHDGATEVFTAWQHLARREISRAALGRVLWRYPMLTTRVSLGIHTHAARLLAKGARVHRHPDVRPKEVADVGSRSRACRALEDA